MSMSVAVERSPEASVPTPPESRSRLFGGIDAESARLAFEKHGVTPIPTPSVPHARLLQLLRESGPDLALLPRACWVLFSTLMTFIGRNGVAWVGQATLGRHAGYALRRLRWALRELEQRGLLSTCYVRDDIGQLRLLYAYGPVAVTAMRLVDEQYRAKREGRAKPVAGPRAPFSRPDAVQIAAPISPPRPAICAEEMDFDLIKTSSSELPSSTPPIPLEPSPQAPSQEQQPFVEISSEDEALARKALTHFAEKRNPKSVPSWWDRCVVRLVALRFAQQAGSPSEKLSAQKDAIDAAFARAAERDRKPNVKYIWGDQGHFLAHLERGELLRRKTTPREPLAIRTPPPVPTVDSPADHERLAEELLDQAERTTGIEREMICMGLAAQMRHVKRLDLIARFERVSDP